jgi:hypothetical protein
MWPFQLDMTKLDCKKALRSLELEAYSSIVAVFRAQGELNSKKMELLQDLQIILHITIDRHKSELRRAINDEKLYTIAKRLSSTSANLNTKWQLEAKRTIPVLPKLPPSTYYKILADQLIGKSKDFFESLPQPSETELKPLILAVKDPNLVESSTTDNNSSTLDNNIKPSEMIAKYLENKISNDNNEILEKLLENKELREKYQQQLLDLKKVEEQPSVLQLQQQQPSITLKTITIPSSTPITTTTISVNNTTNSNQKFILKTLNTGTKLNQTQIKTTDALKNLINSSNVKQLILTNKASPTVILVPTTKPSQFEEHSSSDSSPIVHILPGQAQQNNNNNRIIVTTTNQPIQKFVVLKPTSSNDSKSLKIITSPHQFNPESVHNVVTTQVAKPVNFNSFNYLKDVKMNRKFDHNEVKKL